MKMLTHAAAVVLAGNLIALGAGAASAGTGRSPAPTTCTGTISHRTVGDVTVPAGQTCVLDRARVTGSVTVRAGGRLTSTRSTVCGDVTGAYDPAGQPGHIEVTLTRTKVTGEVRMIDDTTLTARRSSLGSLVTTMSFSGMDGVLERTRIARDVDVKSRGVFTFTKVSVGGSLTSTAVSADIVRSRVAGTVTLDGQSAKICGSNLGGLSVPRPYSSFALGSGTPACRGNTVRGDVNVSGWTAFNSFYDNTVTGHTTSAEASNGLVQGAHNTFVGGVTGAFATLR